MCLPCIRDNICLCSCCPCNCNIVCRDNLCRDIRICLFGCNLCLCSHSNPCCCNPCPFFYNQKFLSCHDYLAVIVVLVASLVFIILLVVTIFVLAVIIVLIIAVFVLSSGSKLKN